jgi:hypothetical protein
MQLAPALLWTGDGPLLNQPGVLKKGLPRPLRVDPLA